MHSRSILSTCLTIALLLAACSDAPKGEQKSSLDSGTADAFGDVAVDADDEADSTDTNDAVDVVDLPEVACKQGWRGFALEAPIVESTSAFSAPGPIESEPRERQLASGLDPQLAVIDAERTVDVLVYRRGDDGRLVHEAQRMTVAEAARVVSLDDVVFVAHRTPMALTVDAQRQAVRSDEVHGFAVFNGVAGYAGLSGQGVEVVVADSGVDDRHPDFHRWSQSGEDLGSRVVGPGPIDGEDHGTKVAGLIAGNGAGSEESEVQGIVGEPYQFRGHAPQVSQIVSVDTPADTGGWRAEGAFDAEPTGDVLEVRTMADGGDRFVLEPESSIVADDYEKLTFRMKLDVEQGLEHRWPRFYVVRWDRDGDGNNDAHAYPRYDESEKDGQWRTFEFDLAGKPRRWKEQMHRMIVRPVVYDDRIIAPRKRDGYSGSGGTSLAAPVVSGAVALMLEQFVERHGVDLDAAPPLPSTVKALLLHTADDLIRDEAPARATPNPDTEEGVAHGRGPDFATGFGLLDAKEAVDLVGAHTPDAPRFREEKIASGEIHVYRIPVEGNEPLRVTLAWDDAPGDAATSQLQPKLVNDLDVVAVSPEGVGHSPWLLDPLPIDPTAYNGIYAPPGDTIASVSQRSRLGIGAKAGDVSALVQVQHAVEWGLFGGNALTDPVLFAH